MSIHTVSKDELEQLAFDSGAPIQIGAHTARLTIAEDVYVARLKAVQP